MHHLDSISVDMCRSILIVYVCIHTYESVYEDKHVEVDAKPIADDLLYPCRLMYGVWHPQRVFIWIASSVNA